MMRCAWCQEEDIRLIPLVNRNPTVDAEREFVCSACSEVERFEHGDELLWHVVDFVSLAEGRLPIDLEVSRIERKVRW